MLKKLIKYDLLWINRVMVFYYALTVLLSILTRIASNFTDTPFGGMLYDILRGVTIAAFVNVIINASIRIWERFRQNCYKDESYLTHTLPVTRGQLYDGKSLSALISIILALAVVIGSFFIAFWCDDLYQYFRHLTDFGDMGFVLGGVFATAILEVLYVIVVGIFGIVLGHRSNSNRVLCSVLIGMMLFFTLQTVLVAVIFVAGFFDDSIKSLFSSNPDNSISFASYRTLIILSDISYLLLNVGLYFGGKKIFEKGVNVE